MTQPITATYLASYLDARGFFHRDTGDLTLPVFGLYSSYANEVTVTCTFADNSVKKASVILQTDSFSDSCGFDQRTTIQARTSTRLSYDLVLVRSYCSGYSPTVMDTDGELRWVGTSGIANMSSAFYDNAIYHGDGSKLLRIELDGAVTLSVDYSGIDVVRLHHNIDYGKSGMLLEFDTNAYVESVIAEVDVTGKVLQSWNFAEIISKAMQEGGDDPSQFVRPSPEDWFHSNAAAYRASDDSLLVSSRENFVICVDYKSGAIKWILGDPTKQWYQFPSLRKYALTLPPGSNPPIGEHALSITHDDELLLFDNGRNSNTHTPPGENRTYSAARRYRLDLVARTATEVATFENGRNFYSEYCSSVYEDAGLSALVDYAYITNLDPNRQFAELLGLTAAGEKVFDYRYGTGLCNTAYNTSPIHWEQLVFFTPPPVATSPTGPSPSPTVTPTPIGSPSPTPISEGTPTPTPAGNPSPGVSPTIAPSLPTLLNLSSRLCVESGDRVLIGGFIITGHAPKKVIVRALGPSLSVGGVPVAGRLTDPKLELHDQATGAIIAVNDNWKDTQRAEIEATGIAPTSDSESAIVETLAPGAYTAVLRSQDGTTGIALLEAYDLDTAVDAKLANISARGYIGTGNDVLIGGGIVGSSGKALVRGLGPSLRPALASALLDPTLELHDANGTLLAMNDDWKSDHEAEIRATGLPPTNDAESAIVTTVIPGSFTAIVRGKGGTSGIGLVEIYNVP